MTIVAESRDELAFVLIGNQERSEWLGVLRKRAERIQSDLAELVPLISVALAQLEDDRKQLALLLPMVTSNKPKCQYGEAVVGPIIQLVADHFGFTCDDIFGRGRNKLPALSLARYISIYFSHRHSGLPNTTLSEIFDRHRTLIPHAINKVEELRLVDPKIGHTLRVLDEAIWEFLPPETA